MVWIRRRRSRAGVHAIQYLQMFNICYLQYLQMFSICYLQYRQDLLPTIQSISVFYNTDSISVQYITHLLATTQAISLTSLSASWCVCSSTLYSSGNARRWRSTVSLHSSKSLSITLRPVLAKSDSSCVCIYVHVHVFDHAYARVCVCVCVCVCARARVYVMYVCMYVCMHACMCACVHVCVHVCMYVCMYVCM